MVWGYLKSELQALPLEPDHNYSIGRKLDSDLVLKVSAAHPPASSAPAAPVSPADARALRVSSRGAFRVSTA